MTDPDRLSTAPVNRIGGTGTAEPGTDAPGVDLATHSLSFLFTDVEGSTRLWEQAPDQMARALERHDAILRTAIAATEGRVVKTLGDGLMAVFPTARSATEASLIAQRRLQDEPWPEGAVIRVRMAIHTGHAESREGDYFGQTLNRAARIMAAGHGGQVLVSAATADALRDRLPDAAGLRDLGEHRLKDLERPERLFQLVHADLTSLFPDVRSLDHRPNNLPTQPSAFVGRDTELGVIRDRIGREGVRLLTLTGPGGTGKTRLALRAAADLIDQFPDGVFFVELASARDTDAVVALIATALGLRETPDRAPLDELRRQLRSQHVMLVLDNLEQVTVAGTMLAELLGACPGLTLLVTSREALQVRGEHLLAVPPLSLPASAAFGSASAAELSQFESIQLFVERARAVRPDFHLTDDNAAAVADICRRLDGLPLAIELATARINLFSPDQLRDRLGSRLETLGSGPRDLPARQQTLRATIEWSYLLLEPQEQQLFEWLSVFAGADIDAVAAVAARLPASAMDEPHVVEGIVSLLNKSLVRQADGGADHALPRVVMLETIREYAAERLDARGDLARAVRGAHAAYFAELGVALWGIASAGEPKRALTELTRDLDNLRAAWDHWVSERNIERLDQLVDGLWHIYEARGWYHATIKLIEDQLQVLATVPPSAERWQQEVTLRTSLARALTVLRGYTADVEDAYAQALALFEGDREVPQVFPVLRSLVSFHGFRGENEKALALTHEILRLADRQGNEGLRVDGLVLLGSNTGFAGDLTEGLGHLDEAIALFERQEYRPRRLRLGNDPRVTCLTTSGFFLWMLGRPDQAVARADRAVALATEMDHPYSLAYALFHSGFLHLWRREPERVQARARSVLELVATHDLPIWRALGTCLSGAAMAALGKPEDGLVRIDEGLDQYQGLRTPPVFWPFVRFTHASSHLYGTPPERGLPLIEEAIAIAGQDAVVAPLFHIVRGDLLSLLPEPDLGGAIGSYEKAYERAARARATSLQLRAAIRLSRLATSEDRPTWLNRLGVVHETVTEGHDTPDLREAAALLADR